MKINFVFIVLIFASVQITAVGQKKTNERLFNHAKNAPDSVEQSVSSLASYLKSVSADHSEIAETIFYWMAINIRYHDDPDFERIYADSVAVMTLRTKEAGCEGTARLYHELCAAASVGSVVIFGFAEGYSFDRQRSSRPNHGWNAVKIEGEWKLVDATWGSGGSTTDGEGELYVSEIDMRYFFADPADFVIDHLPEDSKWQLLDKPVSRRTFYSDEYELKRLAKLGW